MKVERQVLVHHAQLGPIVLLECLDGLVRACTEWTLKVHERDQRHRCAGSTPNRVVGLYGQRRRQFAVSQLAHGDRLFVRDARVGCWGRRWAISGPRSPATHTEQSEGEPYDPPSPLPAVHPPDSLRARSMSFLNAGYG